MLLWSVHGVISVDDGVEYAIHLYLTKLSRYELLKGVWCLSDYHVCLASPGLGV